MRPALRRCVSPERDDVTKTDSEIEALRWCREHNAHISFLGKKVIVSLGAFSAVVEANTFVGAVSQLKKQIEPEVEPKP